MIFFSIYYNANWPTEIGSIFRDYKTHDLTCLKKCVPELSLPGVTCMFEYDTKWPK